MTKAFTENSFASTYRDDFLDSDNYHRILFNSGRALQARETYTDADHHPRRNWKNGS